MRAGEAVAPPTVMRRGLAARLAMGSYQEFASTRPALRVGVRGVTAPAYWPSAVVLAMQRAVKRLD